MPTYEMRLQYPSTGRVNVVHVKADDVDDARIKAVGNTQLIVLECRLVTGLPVDTAVQDDSSSPVYRGLLTVGYLVLVLAIIMAMISVFFLTKREILLAANLFVGSLPLFGFGLVLHAIRDIAINTSRIK